MACFHPVSAFQRTDGQVVFVERGDIARELSLPCGRCIGCRLVRARSWAIRNVHESRMHRESMFLTLTYDPKKYHVASLDYSHIQRFLRDIRKVRKVRFFCCGEYGDGDWKSPRFVSLEGELRGHPHFHVLLYGARFNDGKKIGEDLYRSAALERLWKYGNSSFGAVTFQSAGYVSRYATKKITGDMARDYYKRVDVRTGEVHEVVPEFGRMSLKPGIGYPWFVKFWRDVYAARDGVVVDGKTLPAPRFYDRKLAELDGSVATDKEYERYINSEKFKDDCTPERLLVREEVALARQKFNERNKL